MINATYTTRIDFSVTTSVTYGIDSSEAPAQKSLAPASPIVAPAAETTTPSDSVSLSSDSSRLARGADALFTVLDANQDGSITGQEFTDGATALLRQARGRHHHHHHHRHEYGSEGGGRFGGDRFGGERWGRERAGGDTRLANALSNLFSNVDGDGNGAVTKDELTSALSRAGRPNQPAITPAVVDVPASPGDAGLVEQPSQPAVEGQSTASETIAPQIEAPVSESGAADSTTVGSSDQPVVGDPTFVVGDNNGQLVSDPVEAPVTVADPVVVSGEPQVVEAAETQPTEAAVEEAAVEEPAQDTADTNTPTTTANRGSGSTPISLTTDYAELGRRAQSALYKLIDGNRDLWSGNNSTGSSNGIAVGENDNADGVAGKIADLFAKFDANGDGSISQGEFAAGFGINIQTSQANSSVAESDAPASGSSSVSEEPVAAAEQPVATEGVLVGEQPGVVEEPVAAAQPVSSNEPAVASEPAVPSEPAVEEPAQVSISTEDDTLQQLANAATQESDRARRHHHDHDRHNRHNHDSNNLGFVRPAYVAAALHRYHHHERAGRAA